MHLIMDGLEMLILEIILFYQSNIITLEEEYALGEIY